jgi:plasmid stabilization system protein ParE
MADITWTEQALADVEAVCLYIARDAPRYAELFTRRIIPDHRPPWGVPPVGACGPRIGCADIREVHVQSYRHIYRLLPDEVEILTVHHGASPLTDFEPPNEA